MKKLHFEISIQATPAQVWQVLWDDTTYRQWTAVFHEGSHAVSTWNEGDAIQFLGPGANGMYGRIQKLDLHRHMAFQHIGEVKDGVEQPLDDKTKVWSGAIEAYTLLPEGDGTLLQVDLDSNEEWAEFFEGMFPRAIAIVKQLAEGTLKPAITVLADIAAPLAKVWECWTEPTHITGWCNASEDWHAPRATNDLRAGGRFSTTMAAKDGSVSFDWEGTYTDVQPLSLIAYAMDDARTVTIRFSEKDGRTSVIETFQPESENGHDLQRQGWQAILDNFKRHVESHA